MNRSRLRRTCLLALAAAVSLLFPSGAHMEATSPAGPRFTISFPESASKEPLDGRLLLLISTDNSKEPRLQISEDLSTQQVFGANVDGLKPGQPATIDSTAPGYPLGSLAQVPTGEYWCRLCCIVTRLSIAKMDIQSNCRWIAAKASNGAARPVTSTARRERSKSIPTAARRFRCYSTR